MSADSGLSVLWISRVAHRDGMYNLRHRHSYFHFNCNLRKMDGPDSQAVCVPKPLFCAAPETMHGGIIFPPEDQSINVMFFVSNKALYKMIENFPFELVDKERAHADMLEHLVALCRSQEADAELINASFNHYIRLVMHENRELLNVRKTISVPEQCMAYIDKHYREPLTLEDVANHVGKSRNYTSTLFNEAMGMNMMEYLNSVRMKHACTLMAYSDLSIEDIASECGFSNAKYFGKVFKSVVGISPARYRTSHVVKDCRFDGDEEILKKPYQPSEEAFTYVVNAQKMIEWKSPYEYILQKPEPENWM